ncbi:DNA damage-binding protein 1a [Zea mays]|uniref:DNA damage-binding protein 1a n=1 Tax=Zea mays TaxID=4577 RepID=A0A1D6ME36_MAIZE|nr:DNA damage-binding protein 1a [Zea mays]AQK88937.1 DNA damage-binding protein 1a [Zea mays]
MFWRMTGLSAASPVDTILDKENFTLEELLDEDEIIQECKALNTRLINFLRDKAQVSQLLRYIVEEVPEDSEKKQSFKFPFIACEIFACEIDIILRTLVEDVELMDLLFSFIKPDHPHSTLLAGYFSKVVICLMLRKTAPLMNYVQEHPDIVVQLVDLIGITSIMEVLVRLIGADETIYLNFADTLHWLENTYVLEMIVDKFSSSDSPEVHANAAEILSAVTRCAPPALAAKICSPSFVGRLFHHALDESRPKSVLVHSLSVCISLLDPKRLASVSYQAFRSNLTHGTLVTASPETVDGILESLGDLLKLLDITSSQNVFPTTYGCLCPPLGKHRLKIVEFISVLLTIGSEIAEKKLISQSVIKHCIDLFFQYPYNNFLHHHVENIIVSCLEVKRNQLIDHILNDCGLVGKVLAAEKSSSLAVESNGPTLPSEGKEPPRIGNIGHITRIANKLIQFGNSNSMIQSHLQENSEWAVWQIDVLIKRNEVENVYHWACGHKDPTNEMMRHGFICELISVHVFQDVYFDDESAEVVISSLCLGDDQDSSSLFTNSNWFTFDGDRGINDRLAASVPPSSPDSEAISLNTENTDEALTGETTGGTESLRESASLANELAEVANDNDADATDGEKILCTEEDSQASEGPVDAKEDKTGGASKAANESVPDNALPESHHTDCRCADSSESGTEEDVEIDDEKKSETAMTNE